MANKNFKAGERDLIKSISHKVILPIDYSHEAQYGTEAHKYINVAIDGTKDVDGEPLDVVANYVYSYGKNVTDTVFLLSVKKLKRMSIIMGSMSRLKDYAPERRYWLRTPRADQADTNNQVRTMGSGSGWTVAYGTSTMKYTVRPAFGFRKKQL